MRRGLRAAGAMFAVATLLAILAPGPASAGAGVQQDWVRNYRSGNHPEFNLVNAAIADALGNVYVTGSSYASNGLPDFLTVKYNSVGDAVWVRRYNSPADNWDSATEIALDPSSGGLLVTGQSFGPNDFDYVTIKYSSAGSQIWVADYDGPAHSEDWPTAMAVDGSGNTYVTGYSAGDGTFYDYATVKYGPTGSKTWVARYNGPGNTKDRAWGLGVDGAGNVYVTGDSGEGSPNLSDYVTVKYNSSGVQRWVRRYSSLYDYATALAVDATGNVIVTGYSYGSGTFYDYATVKYSSSGVQQWVTRYDGGTGDDLAYALAVDASGNAVVTGESVGSSTGGDYGTVEYSSTGAQQWVARYNGPGNATDSAVAVALDASGDVYVTGESAGSGTETDFATLKYSASGVQQWLARYNGPGNTFDSATAVAIDGSGNVFVTGSTSKTGGSLYTTIRYIQV